MRQFYFQIQLHRFVMIKDRGRSSLSEIRKYCSTAEKYLHSALIQVFLEFITRGGSSVSPSNTTMRQTHGRLDIEPVIAVESSQVLGKIRRKNVA